MELEFNVPTTKEKINKIIRWKLWYPGIFNLLMKKPMKNMIIAEGSKYCIFMAWTKILMNIYLLYSYF